MQTAAPNDSAVAATARRRRRRRAAIALAIVLLVALAVRLTFASLVVGQHTGETFAVIHGDTNGYLQLGDQLYEGKAYGSGGGLKRMRGLVRPPGYPTFYAATRAAYHVFGLDLSRDLRPIIWPQVAISLAQVAATFGLAWLVLRRTWAATVAGLLAACSPTGAATATIAMADAPFAACFAVAFLGFVAAAQRRAGPWATRGAGVALALAVFFKPAAVYWPIVAVPALLLVRGVGRATWVDLRRLLLPAVLVSLAWTTSNFAREGVFAYSTVAARNLRYDVAAKVELIARRHRKPTQAQFFAYARSLAKRDDAYIRTNGASMAVLQQRLSAETRAAVLAHPLTTVRVLASNLRSQMTSRYKLIHRQLPSGQSTPGYWIRRWVDETDTPIALALWYGPLLAPLPLALLTDRRVAARLGLCWLGLLYVALPTASVANEGSRLELAGEPMALTLIVAGVAVAGRLLAAALQRVRRPNAAPDHASV